MSHIVIIISLFLFCVFIVMVASIYFMNFIMRKYIGNRHQLLEEITNNGTVPKSWSHKFERKINRLNQESRRMDSVKILESARKSYLKKIDGLTAYVKKTNLVQDEETRTMLMQDLLNVKRQWEEKKPNEFNPSRT